MSGIQEMRLHEAMDPRGEGLSLLHYQFSTLQFILGRLEDAQKLAQQSFDLALHTYKADSDQASLPYALASPADSLVARRTHLYPGICPHTSSLLYSVLLAAKASPHIAGNAQETQDRHHSCRAEGYSTGGAVPLTLAAALQQAAWG